MDPQGSAQVCQEMIDTWFKKKKNLFVWMHIHLASPL